MSESVPEPGSAAPASHGKLVRTTHVADCFIVQLSGEIDMANTPTLEAELAEVATLGNLVIDLSEVEFIDSTALGAVIAAYNKASALGHSIHLAGARGPVRRVLEVTRLDEHFGHQDDVADAVQAARVAADRP
jgi:anti-sigma B factor antagonist